MNEGFSIIEIKLQLSVRLKIGADKRRKINVVSMTKASPFRELILLLGLLLTQDCHKLMLLH